MKQNLDILKTEIQEFLEHSELVVFYGYSRTLDALPIVMWDSDRFPDFKQFIKAAHASGTKLIVLHSREFTADFIDNAIDDLADADMAAEDRRSVERRLRELRAYDGFTCAVELSFDIGSRAYIFELRTDWYDEFSDLIVEIDSAISDDDDEPDEGPIGGYFSKN